MILGESGPFLSLFIHCNDKYNNSSLSAIARMLCMYNLALFLVMFKMFQVVTTSSTNARSGGNKDYVSLNSSISYLVVAKLVKI